MDFNIFYLLIAATLAFSIGCVLGVRIGSSPLQFGRLRVGTLALAVIGFVATLVFLAREAEHGSHGFFAEVVVSAIIALPFLILCVASMLAPTRRYEVSVLVLASVFAIAGTGIYYFAFEIEKDEYAGVLLWFVVPVEFFIALFQLGAVAMNRKRFQNENHAA